MPIDLTPTPPGADDAHYVRRADLIRAAGQEQVDAEARLDPSELTADENVIQDLLDDQDAYIEGRANIIGLSPIASGPEAGWHVATTDLPTYAYLRHWAARRARAEMNLLRGEPGGDVPADVVGAPADAAMAPEGKFRKMKTEAERRIDEALRAKYARDVLAVGRQGGAAVGFNEPCGLPPYGHDTLVAGEGPAAE